MSLGHKTYGVNNAKNIDKVNQFKLEKTYREELVRLEKDFSQISKVISAPKVNNFLARPTIKDKKKYELIIKNFEKLQLGEISQKSLKVIAKNGRLDILNKICTSIEDRIAIELDEQQIELKLSHALSDKMLSEFKINLESKLKKRTRIKSLVNSNIVCGYIVKYNKQEYNNSVLGKLTNIAHKLRETLR